MTMCHWGGANSDPNSPNSEEEQQHQRYQEDDRTSVASRRSHRPQQVPPMPAFPPIRDRQGAPSVSSRRSGTYQGGTFELPPLPPSTGSLNSVGRTSSDSIRSYNTTYSLHPRREGPSKVRRRTNSSEDSSYIETLPNELLEDIFLLAIASSFPIEDPNWPLCPMFSKHSYHHSPSNSSSGYTPVPNGPFPTGSGTRSRSGSAGAKPHAPIPTAELLKTAPQLLPTILSQTSRRFRTVLRNAPHLWSHIHITRTVSPQQGQQPLTSRQLLGWLPIYLARSRESGLHITFDTTKFASFSAPLSMATTAPSSATGPPGTVPNGNTNLVHPQSILAFLLPALPRWASVTILTSHIGSPALGPLLHSLSPLDTPALTHLRLAADIWRTGIVGYGAPVPALFVGGSPLLHSVTLEGVHLDWKSCAGVDLPAPGLFSTLRNLELRFIAGRYPRWEQFAVLLEEGCPSLERLVVRDDFDEALRSIDPPPMPYFDEPASPLPPHSPFSTGSTGSNSNASGQTPSSSSTSPASGRFPSHITGLHLTLPPSSNHGQGRGRGRSQSTSSSTSSGSSSTSSSPTSPYYQHHQAHGRHRRAQREFRKINLPFLKKLELHSFNANGGLRSSRSNLALQSASSPSSKGAKAGGLGGGPAPSAMARFLYLLSSPDIQTLALSGLSFDEWAGIADMLGLSSDVRQFKWGASVGNRSRGGSDQGVSYGILDRENYKGRTFPFLTSLEVDLIDA